MKKILLLTLFIVVASTALSQTLITQDTVYRKTFYFYSYADSLYAKVKGAYQILKEKAQQTTGRQVVKEYTFFNDVESPYFIVAFKRYHFSGIILVTFPKSLSSDGTLTFTCEIKKGKAVDQSTVAALLARAAKTITGDSFAQHSAQDKGSWMR